MLNSIVLMGRITKDIELKKVGSDISVCKFSIAVDRKFKDKISGDKITDFIDCQAWRGTADFIARYFNKGSMIAVEGSLQQDSWTDNDGKKRYNHIVNVEQAHFCGSKSDTAQSAPEQPVSPEIEQFAKEVSGEIEPGQEVPF